MNGKRLGNMTLQSNSITPTPAPVPEATPEPEQSPEQKPKPAAKTKGKAQKQDKLITVNIKIREQQQEWLASTARQIRGNNDLPVLPADRVYPQHLIQVAIDLLKEAEIDWDSVQNVEDLRKVLELQGLKG